MPNYALQWEAICWAKSVGCTTYDMWGAPDVMEPEDELWGVWRFKEGFGAQFAPHIGAYDHATSRLLYWAYQVLLPRYLAFLRRRGGDA
jgi:lipid II:glycine glycyltransferase (peptidoglycan interpeptide bridge formation enzyme)